MMKTLIRTITYAVGALVLVGIMASCSTLKSEHYPGTKPEIADDDIGRESIWTFNEKVYSIHRVGSNDFVAATLNWDKKTDTYVAESFPIVFSELGDNNYFLNAKGEDGLYSILRAVPAGDMDTCSWVIHFINSDQLDQDIKNGNALVDKDDKIYTLLGTKEEQDTYLLENLDTLFPAGNASIARTIIEKERTKKPCKDCKKESVK